MKEITENNYKSIFEHPYLAMYKRLHKEFDLKVQLNLFYHMEGFDLSQMSSEYNAEFEENSGWLKFSFHSEFENEKPYAASGYNELYNDCKAVNDQIIRFASPVSLAETTTVHYCLATENGLRALADNDVRGLLGLYGNEKYPMTSYNMDANNAERIRNGEVVSKNGIKFAPIDIVMNLFSKENILDLLSKLSFRNSIWVMIHEQYFYTDYSAYQPDFEEKLKSTFEYLNNQGYKSAFFEELI